MITEAMPCAYCGCVGYHTWAGSGGCPGAVSDRDSQDRAAASQLRALELELQNYKTQNAALRALCGQAADALGGTQTLLKQGDQAWLGPLSAQLKAAAAAP